MSTPAQVWQPGDRLLVRGGQWTVVERTPYQDCEALRLRSDDSPGRGTERTLLTPFDRPSPLHQPRSIAIHRPRRWLHEARRAGARGHPVGGLIAAAAGRVELLPYQLEPALAMLRLGAARVMIADAVGLGKTIQAALVLAELHARCRSFRGLVIVPAGLRDQWSSELAARFALETIPADSAWLARVGRLLPPEVNPWILPGIYVSSFDFLKRPEVLHPLEWVDWDLVVVDEAHAASAGSDRGKAVHAVAARARRVLLLTATPHGGDTNEFNALCRIGALDRQGPPLLVFRRSRGDAGPVCRWSTRRTVVLSVRLTETERLMHRLLDDYTRQVCREAMVRGDAPAGLAAITLKKRALSSAGSLAASARRRLMLLGRGSEVRPEYQPRLPLHELNEEDAPEDAPPGEALATPGLEDVVKERRWLSAIAECAENGSRAESKARLLLRLLRRIRQPAIVFTEFRDTLDRLHGAVAASGHHVRLLHGAVPAGDRLRVVRDFKEHGGILLATDAASEGLNLHHGCRLVIHYELPWSPARLEQRTGRVDRIGQARRVHEILLVARDTAERLVLAPLARRAARARSAGSGFGHLVHALSDARVADAVMEGRTLEPDSKPLEAATADTASPAPAVLRSQAALEAARLERQRGCVSVSGMRQAEHAIETTVVHLRDSVLARSIVCVYEVSLSTVTGSSIYRHVICAREPLTSLGSFRTSADARTLVVSFLAQREPAIRAVVLAGHAGELATALEVHRRALQQMQDRERAMRAALPSAATELVQGGLFDRRAVRDLEVRRQSYDALMETTGARLGALASDSELVASTALVAILIAPGAPR